MIAHEITEADVAAWIAARADEHAKEFGGYGWACVDAMRYESGAPTKVQFMVGAKGLVRNHAGATIEEALAKARAEDRDVIAAEKRAEAARLLAEADKLCPPPAPCGSESGVPS